MMKTLQPLLVILFLSAIGTPLWAQPAPAGGYRISVTTNAYKGQWVYLGYHYGKIKALADSAKVDGSGSAVFQGQEPLPGGIYFLVSPKKELLLELLLDQEQQFGIQYDSSRPAATVFTGSPLNSEFQSYTRYVGQKGSTINQLQQELPRATTAADSATLTRQMRALNQEIMDFRSAYLQRNAGNFLSALFAALQEPIVPPASQHPKGVYDTAYAYRFYKSHYWDGIRLDDARLIRTPFFESRIDRYLRELVPPQADSLKPEIDRMLQEASGNQESYKWLLTHLVQKYINPEFMGQDAVFVHLFEKYINGNPEVNWFTDKYQKYMTDRAYSLMANLIGNPAWDITMTDTSGKLAQLYEVKAEHTIICFWDPTCGHCQEMVPKLDSLYQNKWKQRGVRIFGVMTEGGRENWTRYIREKNLQWIHVHQTEAQREAERNSGKPGFRQLYDVYQTPVLYLLDKEKRILAKKLTWEQLDDFLEVRFKQQAAKK